jgi:hypothetical protein
MGKQRRGVGWLVGLGRTGERQGEKKQRRRLSFIGARRIREREKRVYLVSGEERCDVPVARERRRGSSKREEMEMEQKRGRRRKRRKGVDDVVKGKRGSGREGVCVCVCV